MIWPELWVGKDTTASYDGGWRLIPAAEVANTRKCSPHIAIRRYLPDTNVSRKAPVERSKTKEGQDDV